MQRPSDIKPTTPLAEIDRSRFAAADSTFGVADVAPIVGMTPAFIRRVTGQSTALTPGDVLALLDQDAFQETYIQRSMVLSHLERLRHLVSNPNAVPNPDRWDLRHGCALEELARIPERTVNCVVTSPPYWGMRIYEDMSVVAWADGEVCPYGHEQTPEAYARHTVEMIVAAARTLTDDGSIWWNVMDTFMTRTQIRRNASETLKVMGGGVDKQWRNHASRRYSSGHSFLKDGEQCLIPQMIAERASRAGLYMKTMVTWAKRSSMPEPQSSRVSRNLEYILHITKQRTPKFFREPYNTTSPEFGGRNHGRETAKLSDVWVLPTSSGGRGHGAQFPTALPGRCIALTTTPGDLVVDPFVGVGTTCIAATHHRCRSIGIDTSAGYLNVAADRLTESTEDQGVNVDTSSTGTAKP